MKLKTYSKNDLSDSPICCVGWSNNDEISSISNDHQIFKWSSTSREISEFAKLPTDFVPTDLHWLINRHSVGSGNTGVGGGEWLLISSNDGRFVILNKSARVERNISAHSLCITSGRWSPDGTGLLTASEDGMIKIWSRSGMLRSTVISSEEAIRCARWSPSSDAIILCQGSYISLKPLSANSKIIKWRAHDGLVLTLSWSPETQLIASGGEDCRYKIWDSQGVNMYNSSTDDYPITSLEFNPIGEFLAVGSFNLIKLCNFSGEWISNSRFNDPAIGSLYNLMWSADGTQVAGGCSTGSIICGYIVEKQLISRNLKVTTTGRRTVLFQDILRSTSDVLDFPDRIMNWAVGYGHLIIATPSQVHIFNENYINTPIIVDGKVDVRIIEIGKKFFLIVDASSIWVYTYSGRLHLNPRYSGSQAQISSLTVKCISLGQDTVAVRDFSDQTVIHVFDLLPTASRQNEPSAIRSTTQVIDVAVCRSGSPDDQYIAFIDTDRDLYITTLSNEQCVYKIGTQVLSVMWASDSNILVGLHDACYSIWYCPGECTSDPQSISTTTDTIATDFGRNIRIESFEGSSIVFRSSGTRFTVNVSIYCEMMLKAVMDEQWKQALKICRIAENSKVWASLAAIAMKRNQLEISEEAYCAALQFDKVVFLQYLKNLPQSSPEQMAERSLMLGRLVEAETILLNSQKFSQALALCMRMHQWERALDIAKKNNVDLDLVLTERRNYLAELGRDEWNEKFLNNEKYLGS